MLIIQIHLSSNVSHTRHQRGISISMEPTSLLQRVDDQALEDAKRMQVARRPDGK